MTSGAVAQKCMPHQHNLPVVPICRGLLQLISPPNQWLPFTRLVPEKRGGSRLSRKLGTGCDGRTSPGAILARRAAVVRTAKSCGPGAPMQALRSLVSMSPATDGGNQAWSPGRSRISRKTIAQGMFWLENANQINGKGGLCPPLCRDPVRPFFSTTYPWKPADASATGPVSHCPEPELTHGRPALRGGSRGDAGSLLTIGAKNV
jgi:hypothetical protein